MRLACRLRIPELCSYFAEGSRIPGAASHEALDQLAASSGRMHNSQGDGGRPEGGGHRRGTGSGTEDDIFSHVVGGLDLEAEQRSSSYGQGKALPLSQDRNSACMLGDCIHELMSVQ